MHPSKLPTAEDGSIVHAQQLACLSMLDGCLALVLPFEPLCGAKIVLQVHYAHASVLIRNLHAQYISV